jgi:hypothetical protein
VSSAKIWNAGPREYRPEIGVAVGG